MTGLSWPSAASGFRPPQNWATSSSPSNQRRTHDAPRKKANVTLSAGIFYGPPFQEPASSETHLIFPSVPVHPGSQLSRKHARTWSSRWDANSSSSRPQTPIKTRPEPDRPAQSRPQTSPNRFMVFRVQGLESRVVGVKVWPWGY